MIQSRIREIRRQKGLTLQQVAERANTTAQTIGRLETGTRTLSIKWVKRIAEALDADPSALLSLPDGGDVPVTGDIKKDGQVNQKDRGTVALRLLGQKLTALKIAESAGQYTNDDIVIFDKLNESDAPEHLGHDCLVTDNDGDQWFGKLASVEKNNVTLFPLSAQGQLKTVENCESIALAVTIIRDLRK